MPKIIVIGHLLLKLLYKMYNNYNVVTCFLGHGVGTTRQPTAFMPIRVCYYFKLFIITVCD